MLVTMPCMNPGKTKQGEDWDAYWAHGFLTSCANAFAGNYEGRIRETWNEFFASLPTGARLLDIATGNGAVALLASEFSLREQRRFDVVGIDRALINPAAAWKGKAEIIEGIAFHSRISAETMPFPNESFDAVTGQYALEYTDVPATIKELSRVLAPGGSARFVLHHPDSVVIQTSLEERKHGNLIFAETNIFPKARALLGRLLAAVAAGSKAALADDPEAHSERDALNEAAACLSAAAEASPEPDLLTTTLGHISRAFKAANEPTAAEAALAALAEGEHEVRANLARLDDLLGAVVDDAKMQEIRDLMAAAHISTCNPIDLYFNNKNRKLLMGRQLDCRRLD